MKTADGKKRRNPIGSMLIIIHKKEGNFSAKKRNFSFPRKIFIPERGVKSSNVFAYNLNFIYRMIESKIVMDSTKLRPQQPDRVSLFSSCYMWPLFVDY